MMTRPRLLTLIAFIEEVKWTWHAVGVSIDECRRKAH